MTWITEHPQKMGILAGISTSLLGALIFAINSKDAINPNWTAYWLIVVPVIIFLFIGLGFTLQKIKQKN